MSDHDDADGNGWELMIPFVVTKSHGGPFDDDAFTAGYEMGGFGQRCAVAASLNLLPFTITIRRSNVTQADLIAMHQDLALTDEAMSEEVYDQAMIAEWANVTVDWPAQTIEGQPTD